MPPISLPLTGARHTEVMASYRHLAQFGVMVSDTGARARAVARRAADHPL